MHSAKHGPRRPQKLCPVKPVSFSNWRQYPVRWRGHRRGHWSGQITGRCLLPARSSLRGRGSANVSNGSALSVGHSWDKARVETGLGLGRRGAAPRLALASGDGSVGGLHRHHSNARRGAGRDVHIYQRFLLLYGSSLPATRPYHVEDAEAFLNCAAEGGIRDAVDFGQGHLSSMHDNASAVAAAACISNGRRNGSRDADTWLSCGGRELLPACPIDQR